MNLTVVLLTILMLSAGRNPLNQSSSAAIQEMRPAIEFGHEGGNLRPYKIAFFQDGRVEAIEGAPSFKTRSISPDKVKELIAKASRKNFWTGSRTSKRPRLPDFGFVFVKVRTASGKTIYHHGAQSGRLGEFYSQLAALVLEQP
jgi:hypothetical protein